MSTQRTISKSKMLIPYLMAFYPDKTTFLQLLLSAQEAGADMIEIGIPFSDPVADGPVIREAGNIAMNNGAYATSVLEFLCSIRKYVNIPLILMTYANIVYSYGIQKFVKDSVKAKVKGLIIPDLGLEESKSFLSFCPPDFDLIQFATPDTSINRLKEIAELARGFIYLVSVKGITGSRKEHDFQLQKQVNTIKTITNNPVCVGFGISTVKQAQSILKYADGVINDQM